MRDQFIVQTSAREQFINITPQINHSISTLGLHSGWCTAFIPHTTAALTINEGADPAVLTDLLNFLHRLVPHDGPYTHREGNSDAHIKASLLGSSLHLIVTGGKIELGTWQAVLLGEFDGPRRRMVTVLAGPA